MNIAAILDKTARRLPDKVAFYFDDRGTTYRALQETTESCAMGLQKSGVQRGDRVAIFSPSSLEFVIGWFAAVKLGAAVVPINIMLKARESKYILSNAEVNTVIVHPSQVEIVQSIRPDLKSLKNVILIEKQPRPGFQCFEDLLQEKPAGKMTGDCASDDVATLIYTSGTTGYPKGAMITHANFYSNVQDIITGLHLDEEMIRVSVTPLFHAMGLTGNMLVVVLLGATAVIQAKLDFEEFLQANEKYRATIISGAPALHYMLVNDSRTSRYDLSSWKMATSGSAPLPVEVLRRFEEKFKITMVEAYGLTEVTTAATANPLFGVRKPGSVGLPLPGVQVKVFDENDREISPGQVGEIVLRGPSVMKGYYNNPAATAETLKGGWLHTGDLGQMDEDGYLFILDRKKDMIICSGYNVYPREIEELLHTHPGVLEAAVVGVPDPKRGESPFAFVIRRPDHPVTEEELIRFCRENLAAYKAIKSVKFLEEFPRNPNRKVLKRELREMVAAASPAKE